jgi:hypothetical protein
MQHAGRSGWAKSPVVHYDAATRRNKVHQVEEDIHGTAERTTITADSIIWLGQWGTAARLA